MLGDILGNRAGDICIEPDRPFLFTLGAIIGVLRTFGAGAGAFGVSIGLSPELVDCGCLVMTGEGKA